MSHIWSFSPTLDHYVNKCLTAAQPPDENNKWIKNFGHRFAPHKNDSLTPNREISKSEEVVISTIKPNTPVTDSETTKTFRSYTENLEEFFEVIDMEPVGKFDYLVKECMRDNNLFIHLANRLSSGSIEKVCRHIFDSNNIDSAFVTKFHEYFILELLYKEHNWFLLDILVSSHKKYPSDFKILLKIIFKDVDIPNKAIQDLIETFNEMECTEFMETLTELELTSEEFTHNLFNIYSAYKSSKITTRIQNFILTNISQHYLNCSGDKQFGRLLLAYLQRQKQLKSPINLVLIERIIESHRSPFKRPCMTIIGELREHNNMRDLSIQE